ncbi:MAG TPA: hypothetical protein VGW33_12680 [Terriglobia bacterium]|nr:hypothetical protein [Terriglobia bacterium]
MKRRELAPYLKFEVDRWAVKSHDALQKELRKRAVYPSEPGPIKYITEVALAESGTGYVRVSVAVCSQKAPWSVIYPLSASFLVHANGRVEK